MPALRKKVKVSHPTESKATKSTHHGFEILEDGAWIPRGLTRDVAYEKIDAATAKHFPVPGVQCLWVIDLIEERGRKDPSFNRPRKRSKNASQDRGCNSFMQYRMKAQLAFHGDQQTEVSKCVELLWSTESDAMKFYCQRAAEIESGNLTLGRR
jgi:hypothetical protein